MAKRNLLGRLRKAVENIFNRPSKAVERELPRQPAAPPAKPPATSDLNRLRRVLGLPESETPKSRPAPARPGPPPSAPSVIDRIRSVLPSRAPPPGAPAAPFKTYKPEPIEKEEKESGVAETLLGRIDVLTGTHSHDEYPRKDLRRRDINFVSKQDAIKYAAKVPIKTEVFRLSNGQWAVAVIPSD